MVVEVAPIAIIYVINKMSIINTKSVKGHKITCASLNRKWYCKGDDDGNDAAIISLTVLMSHYEKRRKWVFFLAFCRVLCNVVYCYRLCNKMEGAYITTQLRTTHSGTNIQACFEVILIITLKVKQFHRLVSFCNDNGWWERNGRGSRMTDKKVFLLEYM